MIYGNVQLHNVAEIEYTQDKTGVVLQRFPREIREALKGRSAWIARSCSGCEIRFVSSASVILLTLGASLKDFDITVYCGDFVYQRHTIKAGVKTTLRLLANETFSKAPKELLERECFAFSHNVWRIYIHDEDSSCIFYEAEALDGILRPPYSTEVPSTKLLCYGSSITHGCWAIDNSNSYIQHTAKLLKYDVENKGMAGACYCEKEMADFLADGDWNIGLFELGTNMFNFKTKDFKNRAEYFIKTINRHNPEKKIYIVTPFPTIGGSFSPDAEKRQKFDDYTAFLIDTVMKTGNKNMRYIKGSDLVTEVNYLCYDLVHPSDYGHIRMAEKLAKIFKK